MKNEAASTSPAAHLARKPGQGSNWIKPDKRLAIYLRDGLACVYCGATAECKAPLSLDHLIPNIQGGSNDAANLVTCCGKCNSRRQDMGLEAWLIKACGARGDSVAAFIVSHTALDLAPYRAEAKAIIARRMGDQ